MSEDFAFGSGELRAHSDDVVVTTTLDGVILSWNGGAERLLGHRPREVLGKTIASLLPGKYRQIDALNARDSAAGKPVRNGMIKLLRKDGVAAPLVCTLLPIEDARGCVVGMVRICKDISAFRDAQDALRRAIAQIGRMDEVIDPWLAAVAGSSAASRELGADFIDESRVAARYAQESARATREFLRIVEEECRRTADLVETARSLVQLKESSGDPRW